jgi:hypothetical protein
MEFDCGLCCLGLQMINEVGDFTIQTFLFQEFLDLSANFLHFINIMRHFIILTLFILTSMLAQSGSLFLYH